MRPLMVPVLILSPTVNFNAPSMSHCGSAPSALRLVVVSSPSATVPCAGATVVDVVVVPFLRGGVDVVVVDSSVPGTASNGCVCESGNVVDVLSVVVVVVRVD